MQRREASVRVVLEPYGDLVELDDEGRCCGAGGAFSVLQPELAGRIRTQKLAVIAGVAPDVVASANPGCGLWLAAAGVPVRHPMEIVAAGEPARGGWSRRGGSVAGEFGDIRRRLEADLRGAGRPGHRAPAGVDRRRRRELPVDERRLTRARRAVEKAAAILAEPDDHDQD